jgi:hypothetical protein
MLPSFPIMFTMLCRKGPFHIRLVVQGIYDAYVMRLCRILYCTHTPRRISSDQLPLCSPYHLSRRNYLPKGSDLVPYL